MESHKRRIDLIPTSRFGYRNFTEMAYKWLRKIKYSGGNP
jgi:hypothetical protein